MLWYGWQCIFEVGPPTLCYVGSTAGRLALLLSFKPTFISPSTPCCVSRIIIILQDTVQIMTIWGEKIYNPYKHLTYHWPASKGFTYSIIVSDSICKYIKAFINIHQHTRKHPLTYAWKSINVRKQIHQHTYQNHQNIDETPSNYVWKYISNHTYTKQSTYV